MFLLAVIVLLPLSFYGLVKLHHLKEVPAKKFEAEILQKLDELKQVFLENQIVLRDQTKVYILDLMYVKVDDRNLILFLSNGKNACVAERFKRVKREVAY